MTEYTCQYCAKKFSREKTLTTHKCQRRDRYNDNTLQSRIGFQTFLEIYKNSIKTFDDFVCSPYYLALIRFGTYCKDVGVISPENYVTWLLRNNKRIDDWIKDSLYTEYLIDFLPREDVGPALTRSIKSAVKWSESSGAPAHDWLRYGNINNLVYNITTGKLSGWALYNSASGQEMLSKLTQSHLLKECWPYIDSESWSTTFNNRDKDRKFARQILAEAGW